MTVPTRLDVRPAGPMPLLPVAHGEMNRRHHSQGPPEVVSFPDNVKK